MVNNGENTLFWKDLWLGDTLLCEELPHLFSFILNEDASVADWRGLALSEDDMALPLSVQAFQEFERLQNMVVAPNTPVLNHDIKQFVWGGTDYTAAKYYQFMFSRVSCEKGITMIWKTKCLPKLKVFLWLMFNDRLNTKDLMMRKHWQVPDGTNHVLCSHSRLEDREHLFFSCPFAVSCWAFIGVFWDTTRPMLDRVDSVKRSFAGPCFMEAFACVSWKIWKIRNEAIFQSVQPSFRRWKVKFHADMLLHQFRVKSSVIQNLLLWIRQLDS